MVLGKTHQGRWLARKYRLCCRAALGRLSGRKRDEVPSPRRGLFDALRTAEQAGRGAPNGSSPGRPTRGRKCNWLRVEHDKPRKKVAAALVPVPIVQLCLSQFSTGSQSDRDQGIQKGGGGHGVSRCFRLAATRTRRPCRLCRITRSYETAEDKKGDILVFWKVECPPFHSQSFDKTLAAKSRTESGKR
jgi:hypothetical protein